MSKIAKQLKKIIKERGLSQRKASQLIGVTEAALSHYTIGSREPQTDVLVRISEAFGVSTDELLKGPQWVSVRDKLPEPDVDVLVTNGENMLVGSWRDDAGAWESVYFGWLEDRFGDVVAWHPLPEIYKGIDHGEKQS